MFLLVTFACCFLSVTFFQLLFSVTFFLSVTFLSCYFLSYNSQLPGEHIPHGYLDRLTRKHLDLFNIIFNLYLYPYKH